MPKYFLRRPPAIRSDFDVPPNFSSLEESGWCDITSWHNRVPQNPLVAGFELWTDPTWVLSASDSDSAVSKRGPKVVVWTPLKNISQLGWLFPNIWENKKNGNQTTNQPQNHPFWSDLPFINHPAIGPNVCWTSPHSIMVRTARKLEEAPSIRWGAPSNSPWYIQTIQPSELHCKNQISFHHRQPMILSQCLWISYIYINIVLYIIYI